MDEKKALFRYSALCSKSEHCEFDIREKMRRTDLTDVEQDNIIARLRADNFINDERYASVFVRDKLQFNGWGEQKIRFELRRRKIPTDVIDMALGEVDNEQYDAKLLKALQAKMRTAHVADPFKLRASLIRFGASRGFSFEQVTKAVEMVMNGE